MWLLHSAARTAATFSSENVVSFAGLEPVMRLAQDAGLGERVAERVRLGTSIGSNPAGKTATIVAGMVAGADSIDDLHPPDAHERVDALRHGGMDRLFGQVYATSTLGSFLREFSFGHVRQLEAAARELLVALAGQAPVLAGCCGRPTARRSRAPGSATRRSAAIRYCCAACPRWWSASPTSRPHARP